MPTSPSQARRQGREDGCPDVPPGKKYSFSHLQDAYEQAYLAEAHRIEQRQKERMEEEHEEEQKHERRKQSFAALLEEVLDIKANVSAGTLFVNVYANEEIIKEVKVDLDE